MVLGIAGLLACMEFFEPRQGEPTQTSRDCYGPVGVGQGHPTVWVGSLNLGSAHFWY